MRAPSHRIANCYGLVATAWILATILGCGGEAAEPVRTYDLSPGFWFDEALPSGAADLDLERRENLEALTGLDYASGYERAGAELGVTHWDAELASPDWNLYTSGHGPEDVLMDLRGQVIHSWNLPYDHVPNATPMLTRRCGLGVLQRSCRTEAWWQSTGASVSSASTADRSCVGRPSARNITT
jgi:hypothetical protein